MALIFDSMIQQLHETFKVLPDYRQGQNTQYDGKDATVSTFRVFFMQAPSFLAHQRDMQRKQGRNNTTTHFGVEKVPSDP